MLKKIISLFSLLLVTTAVFAQTHQISGKVSDVAGQPVAGADVFVLGTTNGTTTDQNGNYVLSVSPQDVIRFAFLGFVDQDVKAGNQTVLNVTLVEDTQFLEEVVVVGYGTIKKSSAAGSQSSVSDKAFADQRVTRIDQALQGRATGVQVTNTGGAPGAEVRIRIRGANSILGDNSPLFVVDGFVGADFNDINPNDILSMEVLKDAASTAIYGSRGANGVVLVTTKNGAKNEKVSVSYAGSVSVSNVLKKFDLLNAEEFAQVYNEYNEAVGSSARYTMDDFAKNGGFDYQDYVFRTALGQQHQLALAGGSNSTQYRVSGNFLKNEGIIKPSEYQRMAINANVNSQINKRLSVRFSGSGIVSSGSRTAGDYTGANGVLTQALGWAPVTNPYTEDGGYTQNDPYSSVKSNPLSMINDSESINERFNVRVLGGITYEIIDGLKFDFSAAGSKTSTVGKSWSGDYISNGKPSSSKSTSTSSTVQTTTQLSYDKTFGKHYINAVVANETQSYKYENLNGTATNLLFAYLKYDNLSQAESNTVNSGYSSWALLSYLARVNYTYDNRYVLSLSVRRDGSSKFADGNKFSTFPSAALAWNAHNEQFIKNLGVFSTLKVRASYGLTGNQAISSYATLSSYNTSGQQYAFSNGTYTSGMNIGNPGNPDLKWETTAQTDLGLELGFFKGRLTAEIDYYRKDTRDLLMNKQIADYQGGGTITSNIGAIRNSGIEFMVAGDIIAKKNFTWNSSLNYSYLKNQVVDLGEEEYVTSYADFSGSQENIPEFIYKVGEPLGSIYGLKYLGPWQKSEADEAAKYGMKPGDAKYEDLNGDYQYSGDDAQIIGHGMPTHTLGWNNTITWNKFTINAFFQGVFGVDKMNYTRMMYLKATNDYRAPTSAEALDRYIPGVQEDAYIPAYSSTSKWFAQSSMFLEDASFIRLKNLSVAYAFKVKRVGDFSVSLNATNLFTITSYKGIDPEASNLGGGSSDIRQSVDYAAYPNSRTFTLGVNVTF
jgi:TonB-dependent starch-binding outer membrane protein SusC